MRVALLADLHIGIKKGDQTFFDSQYRFFKEQLVPELNKAWVKDIWILGDVFDTRPTITIQTINRVIDLFKNVLMDFNIRIIVGNHDMFYNTDLGVNSLKILSLLPNVTVYEDAVTETIDGRTIRFQPWITDYTSDIFGNEFGDFVLLNIADWIRNTFTQSDAVFGRLAGDTFGILLPKEKFDPEVVENSLSSFVVRKGYQDFCHV